MSLVSKVQIRDFTQILEELVARLGAKLQTASHADYNLATNFGCDGDMNLPEAVLHFTDNRHSSP